MRTAVLFNKRKRINSLDHQDLCPGNGFADFSGHGVGSILTHSRTDRSRSYYEI